MAELHVEEVAPGVGALVANWHDSWWQAPDAASQVAAVVERAFAAGLHRVEVELPADLHVARRVLHRAALRPEGRTRRRLTGADGIPVDAVRLARLAHDPPPGTRDAFLGVLNASLPTKRVIAQGIVRNGQGEVLLCELTYKTEWDLPGGVVDPHESPASGLVREVAEELGIALPVGALLAVDWLPPYRQWDDALLCAFDLGVVSDLPGRARLEAREIVALHWCPPRGLADHVAPYAARLVTEAVRAAELGHGPVYLEDGLPYAAASDRG